MATPSAAGAAILLVEHVGADEAEVRRKISGTVAAVGDLASGSSEVLDEEGQERLWKSRKDAVPLLYGQKGRAHPIAFMEDVAVENVRLADYIAGLEKIAEIKIYTKRDRFVLCRGKAIPSRRPKSIVCWCALSGRRIVFLFRF